jgi:predicted metal-dependent enzyme (double-stranded beta helix superfamily)
LRHFQWIHDTGNGAQCTTTQRPTFAFETELHIVFQSAKDQITICSSVLAPIPIAPYHNHTSNALLPTWFYQVGAEFSYFASDLKALMV